MGMSAMNGRKLQASVTVEAAIVIPVLVLVLVPFLYLLRIVLAGAMLEADLQNILTKAATESYVLEKAGIEPSDDVSEGSGGAEDVEIEGASDKAAELEGLGASWTSLFAGLDADAMLEQTVMDLAGQWYLYLELGQIWTNETLEAWGVEDGWSGISLLESRFFYSEEGRGGLIQGVLEVSWSFPGGFTQPSTRIVRTVHAFLGEKDKTMGSVKSEAEETEEIVYRIGSGAHYHKLSCFLIDKNIVVLTESQAQAKGLQACPNCGGGEGTVYATVGGEKYHTHTCAILFPDLVPMSLMEAIAAGLTQCGLCYGSEEYFR